MSDNQSKILVVDDDEFTAELTGMILESAGYDIIIAGSGIDALQMLSDHTDTQVVVSDMNMPTMNGIQLFSELRRQGFSQKFVLLTGDDAGPLRTAHPDMDAIITKDEQLQEALPDLIRPFVDRA